MAKRKVGEVGDVVIRTDDLVSEVTSNLHDHRHYVSRIVNEFVKVVVGKVADGSIVHITGLGEFHLQITKPHNNLFQFKTGTFKKGESRKGITLRVEKMYHVRFRKAHTLKTAIEVRHGRAASVEKTMEKYGVDESGSEQEKKAAQGCPNCGSKVEKHGDVLACVKCGTEPFETPKK